VKFNDHLKRGFFNFADDSNGYNSYLAYCCTVGQIAISLFTCNSGGVVLVSTTPLGDDLPEAFLNELGLLAREHGALDGTKIDQFSIIEFETLKAAERFAIVLTDWLKDCEFIENLPRLPDTTTQSVQYPGNPSVRTDH
jgi:hypothetical protein